ncbi:N-methyl-L-tryptophan oxidase [Rhizobium sp. SYY.PMSO]|uniref:N-methyl-L-tryptophan oxidase n=1 Tax=Rhizobium sp. SYY.PMSO TaxID=3382192 RepID=UPI00398FB7A3
MTFDADVGVVGLGAMGSMTAWRLAKRGVSVLGWDRLAPGHDQSASGGESRIFRTAYKEGPAYVPLLIKSRHLWNELEADTGTLLLNLIGAISMAQEDSDYMRNVIASCRNFDLDHEILSASQVRERYPVHTLDPGEVAVLDRWAGYVRPDRANMVAARQAESLGATLHRYTPIRDIEFSQHGATVYSDTQEWRVRKLVLTAGPWTRRLLPGSELNHKLVRIVLAWYRTENDTLFQPDVFPIFMRLSGGLDFCGWPMINGDSVKLGRNGSHGVFEDPDKLNRNVESAWFIRWRRMIRDYLPGIIPDPVRVGAYMDSWTPSGNAVVDLHPDCSNLVTLYGFSGHGYKLSPIFGEIAARLALEEKVEQDISIFRSPALGSFDAIPNETMVP